MKAFYFISIFILLIVAPLVGATWAEHSMAGYLVFPPVTTVVTLYHAGFSWFVFTGMLIAILVVVVPFFSRVINQSGKEIKLQTPTNKFPAWGWIGIMLMGGSWVLAWTRFIWMDTLQIFTFTPIWLGYIILINALTWWRTGKSLITHNPNYLIALFGVSAVFWWYFEYLNQFVENWYYVNVEELSPGQFFLYATLPFSTVLPAVISTKEYLGTFNRFSSGLDNYFPVIIPNHRRWANLLLIAGILSLAAISLFPNFLFPLLWLAPLVIMTAAMILAKEKTIFSGIAYGRWRELYLLGMAALVCGFFWEMWNFHSLARWEYSIPFVNRFHLFEMPILGYAGYLPFGLQCGVVAAWLKRWF